MNGSSVIVDTKFGTTLQAISKDFDCSQTYYFIDDGSYGMDVKKCTIETIDRPLTPYLPILAAFLTFSLIILM